MKKISFVCALLSLTLCTLAAKTESLTSPNGIIRMVVSLDFLEKPCRATIFQDGRNAHRIGVDYKKTEQQVTPQSQLTLRLVRNGGWCAVIE